MKMLDKLIGAQLVKFDETSFTVKNQVGQQFTFDFEEDEGDCCGFNELELRLLISNEDISRNPVITKVEEQRLESDDNDHVIITMFGENKKLAEVESYSSSGSGWCYGACVVLKCVQTGESETVTEW